MNVDVKNPPREFEVGFDQKATMKDCASIALAPNEQVTFVTENGAEYDVARKDWGFYATPSINGRLSGFGLRAVMVRNRIGRYFILLVEKGKEAQFDDYVRSEPLQIVRWLDPEELDRL